MSFGRVQEVSSPAIATAAPGRHLGSQGRGGGGGGGVIGQPVRPSIHVTS